MAKEQNLLFSIIVPVYNAEKYLDLCIGSLLAQQYQNIEIILVDDGSTDNSLEICKAYERHDNRVKVYHKDNGGQGSARNWGLAKADGDYILFVDSDDSIAEDTIQANIDFLKQNPQLDFLQFPIYMMYGSESQYIPERKPGFYTKTKNDFISLALENNTISWIVCDKIFNRKLIEGMTFREDIKYEDNYFMMRLLPRLASIYVSDKGVYYYYHRENSTTTSATSLLKEKSTMEVLSLTLKLLHGSPNKKLFYNYLLRWINVEKSLKTNFLSITEDYFRFKKDVALKSLITSRLDIKSLIKILIYKFF